jgi:hypothetical protein
MIDDGADPLQIKRRMGHEDVRTTLNLYGHLFEDREGNWSPLSTAGEPLKLTVMLDTRGLLTTKPLPQELEGRALCQSRSFSGRQNTASRSSGTPRR